MELIKAEHRKLWSRRSTQIGVLVYLLFTLVFGGVLSYQWFSFGSQWDSYSSSFENHFDGYENIRRKQEYASQWDTITDETFQEMAADCQKRLLSEDAALREPTEWSVLNTWIRTLWPELEEADNPLPMIYYVNPEQLTGFYERRQEKLEEFLEANGQEGEEKAFFLEMNAEVGTNFPYRWTGGWSFLVGNAIESMRMVLGLLLAVAAAPVFAGEWHRGMRPVISVTKHGRRRTAAAKVLAALAFCLEMVGVTAAGSVLCQVIFLGTEGWDMPVQFIKLLAAVPWNMLQAEIYEYVFLLIGGLGFTAVTLLISSLAKSTFAALVLSLGVLYVPMAVSQYLPLWGQKLLELLPMVGNSLDIFRTEVYHVFGQIIWSPWMLLAVPFLIGLCCVPAAFWGWCRRQR